MEDKLNIAVFVDYDNIEIGVKSTLRREFDVSITLDALRERGDVVAKFAYANWGLQPRATRLMAENAVQMVQRNPSPRGDKNGGDINLALDALEMAFTHDHVNAFAIVSGDSDFIPLVNKLREFGKRVFIVGGKAFTSNILQQNCHEFISYESLLGYERKSEGPRAQPAKGASPKHLPKSLDPVRVMPLIRRTLRVLERRNVQPQLGLLKSTMLQLDPRFSEREYGAGSFSDLVEKLRDAGYLKVTGSGGQVMIETRSGAEQEKERVKPPEEALPVLRGTLEAHRVELENGAPAESIEAWVEAASPGFDWEDYGFREFAELLNFAQDKLVARVEPHEEKGLLVFLGEEFRPPEPPVETAPEAGILAPPEEAPAKPARKRSSGRRRPRKKEEAPKPGEQ